MMTRTALALLILSLLAPSGQALKMIVWDRETQSIKLGDGESSGGRLTVRLVPDYDGPVVVLFAQSDDERARNLFPGLKSRYTGTLSGGELSLLPGAGERSAANTPQTLARFLTPFKLTVSALPAGQSLSLPGLRAPTPTQNR